MKSRLFSTAAASVLCSVCNEQAQTTAFTYQGRLLDASQPTEGVYDLRFILYGAETGGSPLGDAFTNLATRVRAGLFTVELDFGPGVFPGPDRWLQIGVRTNGGVAGFAALLPRQALRPTPYSLHAHNAAAVSPNAVSSEGLQDGAVTAGKVAAGSLTPGDLDLPSFAGTFWRTAGNAGIFPQGQFLGTTDNQSLELRVNNRRVLRLDPHAAGPTLIGGEDSNTGATASAGVIGGGKGHRLEATVGSTIDGGLNHLIEANASQAVIGGGQNHQIGVGSADATISGGNGNIIETASAGATIGGGSANEIGVGAARATVGGGASNRIGENAPHGVIAGGDANAIEAGTDRFEDAGADPGGKSER